MHVCSILFYSSLRIAPPPFHSILIEKNPYNYYCYKPGPSVSKILLETKRKLNLKEIK